VARRPRLCGGKPGNEYQVTVRNRQGADVLAVMSVDGVNVVTGETAHPLQSGYVLGPRGGVANGWRKSLCARRRSITELRRFLRRAHQPA
jgi:hypothetical protein